MEEEKVSDIIEDEDWTPLQTAKTVGVVLVVGALTGIGIATVCDEVYKGIRRSLVVRKAHKLIDSVDVDKITVKKFMTKNKKYIDLATQMKLFELLDIKEGV